MQAGKSITGILKPLEILTRPQLPRKAPAAAAAAGQHQAGAAAASQAPAAPGASSAPGSSSAPAGVAGTQAAQQNAPAAEVCVRHPVLYSNSVFAIILASQLWMHDEVKLSRVKFHIMGSAG